MLPLRERSPARTLISVSVRNELRLVGLHFRNPNPGAAADVLLRLALQFV